MLCKSSPVNPTVMKLFQDGHTLTLIKIPAIYFCQTETHRVLFVQGVRDWARGPGAEDTFEFVLYYLNYIAKTNVVDF